MGKHSTTSRRETRAIRAARRAQTRATNHLWDLAATGRDITTGHTGTETRTADGYRIPHPSTQATR